MPNWLESMQQTYEYYIVDPKTWGDAKQIFNISSSSIEWDSTSETRGSASINLLNVLDECYIRIYLITVQNGIRERFPLGTFLFQTPSLSFDGKTNSVSLEGYSPLIELKEKSPPLGYSILKKENIIDFAYKLTSENVRAPVIKCSDTKLLDNGNFISNTDDTWLTFISDLLSYANYSFSLDELGHILFSPIQDTKSLQPVWTFDDGNSSILYQDVSIDRDLYGIPNVVEVIYSDSNKYSYAKSVNNDPNSPISTVTRGREIIYRVTNPNINSDNIQQYADQLLRNLSALEYTVKYSHGYCPVRIGDCVMLNYSQLGLKNVKAKVINQSIDCSAGCKVSETATFTSQLWG